MRQLMAGLSGLSSRRFYECLMRCENWRRLDYENSTHAAKLPLRRSEMRIRCLPRVMEKRRVRAVFSGRAARGIVPLGNVLKIIYRRPLTDLPRTSPVLVDLSVAMQFIGVKRKRLWPQRSNA